MTQSKYACPACSTVLTPKRLEAGASWICGACDGRAVTMAMVRKYAHAKLANDLWNNARASSTASARRCPDCRSAMRSFEAHDATAAVELDACPRCQLLWFDATELARLSVVLKESAPSAELAHGLIAIENEGRRGDYEIEKSFTIATLLWLIVRALM